MSRLTSFTTTSSGRVSRRVLPFSEEVFHAPPMANNKYTKGRPIVPGIRLDSYEEYDNRDLYHNHAEDMEADSMEDFIASDSEQEEYDEEEEDEEEEHDEDQEEEEEEEEDEDEEEEEEDEDEEEDEESEDTSHDASEATSPDTMIEDSDINDDPPIVVARPILDADDCMMDIASEIQAIENTLPSSVPTVAPVRVTMSFMYVPGTDVTITFTPTQMNEIIHANPSSSSASPGLTPSRPRRLRRWIEDSDSCDSDTESSDDN